MVEATPAADARRRLAVDPRAIAGGVIVGALFFVAIAAPLLAPHDPLAQDLLYTQLPPSWRPGGDPAYLFGTDSLGRDILSRLIYGARIASFVAIVAASLACFVGSLLGLIAGYFRGAIDMIVSRLIDIWMSFPPVLLSIVLAAAVGAGLGSVVLAIVVIDWTRFARVVRAETQLQRQLDYVVAARVIGLRRGRTLFVEVLPNVLPLIVTLLTVEMGIAVIVEAILSFVGLSVSTDTPTWGGMIAEGRQVINQVPWLLALPIGCIVLTVLGFNLLGDGLRATLDPVQRR
ncbi:MAG: ABC transporter permease [Bauldia sp.]|nr:ABC transporter permease [Bauldia sp.]